MASSRQPSSPSQNAPPVLTRPERLVGMGFRRGFAALETGDMIPWQFCWQELANIAGPDHATTLVADLSCWVRAVKRSAGRRIETFPSACPGFCRDECLAISMIAASQHASCPALRACAYALLGSNALDEPMRTAQSFAATLTGCGLTLSDQSVCHGLSATSLPASARPN